MTFGLLFKFKADCHKLNVRKMPKWRENIKEQLQYEVDKQLGKKQGSRRSGSILIKEKEERFLVKKSGLNYSRYEEADKLCELFEVLLVLKKKEDVSFYGNNFRAKLYRPHKIEAIDRTSNSLTKLNFEFNFGF